MVGEGGAYGFRGSFEAGKGQGSADVSLLTCSDASLPAGGAIVAFGPFITQVLGFLIHAQCS